MNRENRIPLGGALEFDTLTGWRRVTNARRGITRFAKNTYRRRVRYAARAQVRRIFRELRHGGGQEAD